MRLFERAPGASGFGPVRQLRVVDDEGGVRTIEPALALCDDGAAVVAWRGGEREATVRAITRPAGGAFGTEAEVAPGRKEDDFGPAIANGRSS